jgi:hypothetical protein
MSPAMQTEEWTVAQLFRQENLQLALLDDFTTSGDML